jgi:serine protease Do
MKNRLWMYVTALLGACTVTPAPSTAPQPAPNTAEMQPAIERRLVQDSIVTSRQNAITRTVRDASGAVVTVGVIELVQKGGNLRLDPIWGFYLDPARLEEVKSLGSGFIISEDGLVLTNQHVIGANAARILVHYDHRQYEAELIGADEFTDIALLKIKNAEKIRFPYLKLGDSDTILVGEWVIAMGNPFGLFEDGKPTVTVGVVSAVDRDFKPDPEQPRVYTHMIQTDAAINSGNSGGPLLNSMGEVIGMNTFIFTPTSGYVGLSFAIPANRVSLIAEQLKNRGVVTLDYDPGFELTAMTPRLAYQYQIPYVPHGLLVVSVNKDGPAYEAGIMPRDIVLRIGDERIQGNMHAMALLREYAAGDSMAVEILRSQRRYETKMLLKKRI